MVLVSHRHRFIFLKTYKTAGTSIDAALERFCLPGNPPPPKLQRAEHVGPEGIVGRRGKLRPGETPVWWGHMPAVEVRDRLGTELWQSYFKFTTIRNPYERLVSHFAMRNAALFGGDFGGDFGDDPDLGARRAAFEAWLATSDWALEDLRIYAIDGAPVVDDAIRFESLGDDLARICARLRLPCPALPHFRDKPERRARVGDWRSLYTDASRAWVAQHYGWETSTFGYQFDSAPPGQPK